MCCYRRFTRAIGSLLVTVVSILAGGMLQAQAISVMDRMTIFDPQISVRLLCSAGTGLPCSFAGDPNTPPFNPFEIENIDNQRVDALGSLYRYVFVPRTCRSSGGNDVTLYRVRHDSTVEPVLAIAGCLDGFSQSFSISLFILAVDSINGTAWIKVGSVPVGDEILEISGLPTLLDIILSYQPPATLSFNVPVRPEGLPGGDSFSVYSGDVRTASDISQASALQCTVPSGRPPVVGEQLTVPDPLPDPAPGESRYYLAAVNYQGQRRAGRSSINGTLQGRDAAALPGCQ